MIEGCSRLGFSDEPLLGLRILHEFRGQELERNSSFKLGILGFVDDAHPASSQFFDYLVPPNRYTSFSWLFFRFRDGLCARDGNLLWGRKWCRTFLAELRIRWIIGAALRALNPHFSP